MSLTMSKEEIRKHMEHNRPIMEGERGSIVDNYSQLMTNIDKDEILRARDNGDKIEQQLAEKNKQKIVNLKLEDLSDSPNNVFKEYDEKKKKEMVDSIKEHGVLEAIFVRPVACIEDEKLKRYVTGKYEILAGHNRVTCAREAGLTEIPAIIVEADDSTAVVFITQTNIQREHISDVERARAMRLMYDKYKKDKGGNDKVVKGQMAKAETVENTEVLPKCQNDTLDTGRTDEMVAEEFGVSKNSLHRKMALAYCTDKIVKYYEAGRGRTNLTQEHIYYIHRMNEGTQDCIPDMLKAVGAKMTTAKAKQLRDEYARWHAEEQPGKGISFPRKRMREIFQENLGEEELKPKRKRSSTKDMRYFIPDKYFPVEIKTASEREKYIIDILEKMNG